MMKGEDRSADLAPTVFHWPQHSFLLEHIRLQQSPLTRDLQDHLKQLNIFSREAPTQPGNCKISLAAKQCVLWSAHRRFFITFDIFLARDRPGLGMEDDGQVKKKKRRNRTRKKKPGNSIEESLKTLFCEEPELTRTI